MAKPELTLAQMGASLMGLGCLILFGVPVLFIIVVVMLAVVGVF